MSEPPFPGHSFSGESLSQDDRIGIYLEDGYWTETDAAVCFKWEDRHTGQVRYIYHGNDGTQMPWNDTAQLDYLQPEVREMVIQTILDVARRFPVIRFDAAMTLAMRHIERLWYQRRVTVGLILQQRIARGIRPPTAEGVLGGSRRPYQSGVRHPAAR